MTSRRRPPFPGTGAARARHPVLHSSAPCTCREVWSSRARLRRPGNEVGATAGRFPSDPRACSDGQERPDGMIAYIARRILLMIPTLFGIMLISFVIIQFAPGGPVERVLAQLQGNDTSATSRIAGGGGGDFAGGSQAQQHGGGGESGVLEVSRRAGAGPRLHQAAGGAVRLRQAAHRALRDDAVELPALRFRQELLPRRARAAAHQGEAAGLDLAGALDDAAVLRDLHPARHPQGGVGRIAVRYLDVGGRHHRLRHPGLPLRHPADRAVRRGLVAVSVLPAARPDLGELLAAALVRQDRGLRAAHRAADPVHGAGRVRHLDPADEELVPRRDPQAVRADGPHEGAQRAARALWPRVPQRHADRDRGLPRRVHPRLLHGLAADRDRVLAGRAGAAVVRIHREPRLRRRVRERSTSSPCSGSS